ncbi:CpXC domain-containing protein [Thermogemmatispora onikobensis]|uniref:CpXC domain-containing protein n=1 Tax=Thermogemmatispora onikobensis TaxID=732234 RepID=UPI0008539E45|nr:CpXC domain-containing protein [Thermogemmatispora onikobensis]
MSQLASRTASYKLICRCGHGFECQVYEYVNVARDPQLRYAVLAGRLNVVTCPSCGRRALARRPFIYSDPPNRLLAYVHPRDNVPPEGRELIEARLRDVYERVAQRQREELEEAPASLAGPEAETRQNADEVEASETPGEGEMAASLAAAAAVRGAGEEIPPLQVVFGLDQLALLINAGLSQDERLGKIALRTQSRSIAQRGQMFDIARRLAREMQCIVEEEEQGETYTVWLYGPRRQIGAIMRALAPRG